MLQTRVLNHHGVASRRPEFVSEPDVFKPERWLRANTDQGLRHKFAYMPFGFGARRCLGKRYAEQEMMLVLAKVSHQGHACRRCCRRRL